MREELIFCSYTNLRKFLEASFRNALPLIMDVEKMTRQL